MNKGIINLTKISSTFDTEYWNNIAPKMKEYIIKLVGTITLSINPKVTKHFLMTLKIICIIICSRFSNELSSLEWLSFEEYPLVSNNEFSTEVSSIAIFYWELVSLVTLKIFLITLFSFEYSSSIWKRDNIFPKTKYTKFTYLNEVNCTKLMLIIWILKI